MHRYSASHILALVLLPAALLFCTAAASAKPPLTYSVEDGWRSVSNPTLSNDGRWAAYGAKPELGDGTLIVRNVQSGKEYREARGASTIEDQPVQFAFTYDSRYLIFSIAAPYADVKAAKKKKKEPADQPKAGLGILNLETGEVVRADRVASFKLPAKRGNAVAFLHEPAQGAEESQSADSSDASGGDAKGGTKAGAELIVRDLGSGAEISIANVVDYGLTEDGAWLTYIIKTPAKKPSPAPSGSPTPTSSPTSAPTSSPTASPSSITKPQPDPAASSSASPTPNPNDGVYIRKLDGSDSVPVLKGSAIYKGLITGKDHPQIAFVTNLGTHAAKRPAWSLYYWSPLSGAEQAVRLVSTSTAGVPAGYDVSDKGAFTFSKDGARLYMYVAPIAKAKPPKNAEPPLNVDIWWTKEPDIPPWQTAIGAERKSGIPGVVQLAQRRFVPLGTKTIMAIEHNENPHYAIGLASTPYDIVGSWRYADCDLYLYCDAYVIDLQTGNRRQIETRARFQPLLSPDGNFVVAFDALNHVWYTVRTSDLHRTTLSVPGVHFEREDWDQADEPAPYGLAGWTPGDRSVLVYDRYDLWQFDPQTGRGRNVTARYGRSNGVELRHVSLENPDDFHYMPSFDRRSSDISSEKIDPAKPIVLLGMDENSKAESLYNLVLGPTPHAPILRTKQDVIFGAPIKARNAATVILTRERFDMEPDLYATTLGFGSMRRISDVEPRQRQYAWGHSELIDYVNADGVRLKAIITKPGDFDPHKKYPMVLYEYEDRSNSLNEFVGPAPVGSSEPNIAWYASNGYVVIQPDIIYKVGHPGMSAVHCIVPAVERAIALGFVDPKRVAMTGHSWGGFQSMFLSTHSDVFAAFAGGAGLSDLLSWNDEMRWGLGSPGMAHLETFQGRMGGDLWHNFNLFLENSSVFSAPNVHVPFLTLHNDADGNVTWFQGIEFFMALRRLDKQAWLINYNGEDHGIYKERDNQKDWTVRMDQFLAHYLKGVPAPDWMRHPILNENRGARENVKKFEASR